MATVALPQPITWSNEFAAGHSEFTKAIAFPSASVLGGPDIAAHGHIARALGSVVDARVTIALREPDADHRATLTTADARALAALIVRLADESDERASRRSKSLANAFSKVAA